MKGADAPMRRILSLSLALGLLALSVFSVCCAAAADSGATEAVPVLDKNFDVDLATTLIVIICAVLSVALVIIAIVLGKRNIHN